MEQTKAQKIKQLLNKKGLNDTVVKSIKDKVKVLDKKRLNNKWNAHPHTFVTQRLGDDFIDNNDFCVLKVPSAVVKGDFNLLINPYHKDIKKIKISNTSPFPFDNRLFS